MVVPTLDLLRLAFMALALILMLLDYFKHRELKYVFIGYALLAISTLLAVFENFFDHEYMHLMVSFTGITLAGLMFAKTSYSAHARILSVKRKARKELK